MVPSLPPVVRRQTDSDGQKQRNKHLAGPARLRRRAQNKKNPSYRAWV